MINNNDKFKFEFEHTLFVRQYSIVMSLVLKRQYCSLVVYHCFSPD